MENSPKPNNGRDIKQAYRTAYLIAGFLKQTLTGEEKEELDNWIMKSDENMALFERMTDEQNIGQAAEYFRQINLEEELQQTKSRLKQHKPVRLWIYAISAAVLILMIVGVYLFQLNGGKENSETDVAIEDVLPGSNVATLLLANGEQVALKSSGNDTAINKYISVSHTNGEVVYHADTSTKAIEFNTLAVPKKGQYRLVLPDGSIVWLNAASSIRFPVAFIGKERKVFVTGEAYFQVAKDKTKPFRVVAGDIITEALGTQFNVNAYPDETFFTSTLIEGSVSVSDGSRVNILKPGEQAQITGNSFKKETVDVDVITAWKSQEFKFKSTSINEIMRQVERWYDVEVDYKNNIDLHLNATIERNIPLSKLLQILEATGQVHFKIQNRTVIVTK